MNQKLYKLKILLWYIKRPNYWEHLIELIRRKLISREDLLAERKKSTIICKQENIDIIDAFFKLKLISSKEELKDLSIDYHLKENGLKQMYLEKIRINEIKNISGLGGSANLDLLYAATLLTKAHNVLETGVAYGWSSLAILTALEKNEGENKLISIDMPYPATINNKYVGVVIPNHLRRNWELIRLPDRPGIKIAIKKSQVKFDLIHYDSDKSIWGRNYSYNLMWDALRINGILISDDIEDNLAFYNFAKRKSSNPVIIRYKNKYIGIIKKES